MNTGERGLLGRPVLIPQAAGTCLGGLISSALAQGWLLGIVPAWDGPSLSLHCVFWDLCLLSSVVHGSIISRILLPQVPVFGGLGVVGRSSWELNSAGSEPR